MARNLENSTSENSNIQEMGPRRSTRLNMTISGVAPSPRGSTMATTAVATTVATHGELCHSRPTAPRPRPKPCHSKPNASPMRCRAEPKPRTHMCHTPRSPLTWPSLLPPSSLLSWPFKQPKSAQYYLNHPDLPPSQGHSHHISLQI